VVRALALLSLSKAGYTVLPAANGREALQVAVEHGHQIDLVLTDVIMPVMGGPELVETLRPQYPQMKVLFTSGYADDAVRHGILEAPVAFIQKPYSPTVLVQKVRQVLDADRYSAN
jgi:CheY-like chemotaxis protein